MGFIMAHIGYPLALQGHSEVKRDSTRAHAHSLTETQVSVRPHMFMAFHWRML